MRIISQDGCCDIPYEQAVVARLDRTVVAYPLNDLGSSDCIQLADYSTEEKAIKAMEMCRKHYATAEYNRRIIPKGDTLVDMEIAKELLTSGFIFQFPAEEEV